MTKDEFIKKYKDFQLPNETQEMIDKSVDNAKSVLNEYESEYKKIQKSFKFYFKKKGYIKPYDTHDFFDWIAEKYPDASLPHIIEVAKDPNSYKRFHEHKKRLWDGSEKNEENKKESNPENLIHNENSRVQKLANRFFNGELEKLKLLEYLSENFVASNPKCTDLTKYNHIYKYFNENESFNLEHRAYKELIKELFDYDYQAREIRARTQKHLKLLKNLTINYRQSLK
ncbi:hypothetical protein JET18_05155 [Chryseobacterium sp. L7]|uniref:Uncharacterized protein n=1 Tax=Chryseobacterium endalhagicum TaxID=2797638 RepID=A0ABS1QC51_9FLAO|nr:hypothetical protein [Chryseobacterium endalhagicum]MBL1220214.1 hypothetical protein [Chryseobacterium endalhagicum]